MGYDKEFTKSLPTWRDRWWEFDSKGNKLPRKKTKSKSWQDLEFYKQNPKRAAFRKAWESGERDFEVLWEIVHG